MRWLITGLLSVGCITSTGAVTSSSSASSSSGGAPDAAVEVPCEDLPAGITQGQDVQDGGVLQEPVQRLVLMGGGTEVDGASRAFVEAAGGGDVLVLRATGSVTSYTSYFSVDLSANPAPATVTTLRVDDLAASSHAALTCRVGRAEALWLAGGDQWDYSGQWSGVLHDAVNLVSRRATVGGTSAGAMVLGGYLFSARDGSVTSEEVLLEPTAAAVHVVPSPLAHPWLSGVVLDTHFTQRAREGRLLTFAAHALQQGATQVLALGLDEETALVVQNGSFEVQGVGSVWAYDVRGPVTLQAGQPLSLQGIQRRELGAGTTGSWPLLVDSGEPLEVRQGVLVPGP